MGRRRRKEGRGRGVFRLFHELLTLAYEEGQQPDEWLVSKTLCLFKGKGEWRDPDRWRPIAMSIAICRLLMRWVYRVTYPLISPRPHSRQFGGRQGVSTTNATQVFLDELDRQDNIEAIVAFDVYHAFDSPPKS